MIWKIWMKCEMLWKIWKKSKLKSEKIWIMRKKSRLNCEMIWKIWKKIKLNSEKMKENSEKIWTEFPVAHARTPPFQGKPYGWRFSFYHSLLLVVNASWYFVLSVIFSFYNKHFQTTENGSCPENSTAYPKYDCNKTLIPEGMYKNRKLLLIDQQVLICWIRDVVIVW